MIVDTLNPKMSYKDNEIERELRNERESEQAWNERVDEHLTESVHGSARKFVLKRSCPHGMFVSSAGRNRQRGIGMKNFIIETDGLKLSDRICQENVFQRVMHASILDLSSFTEHRLLYRMYTCPIRIPRMHSKCILLLFLVRSKR